MKKIFFVMFAMFSINAFATVDAMTEAWIVIQDIQEEENFTVQKVPVIGCYGLSQGPQLVQFTAPFEVESTMGCGSFQPMKENINALSCAKLVDSVESADYSSFKKVVLDISACAYKENKKFITMVRTAAARNFPQTSKGKIVKGKDVELVLIK